MWLLLSPDPARFLQLAAASLVLLVSCSIDAQVIENGNIQRLYANRSPPHSDITNANIRRAVIEFVSDSEFATQKYGNMEAWDTSEVTDMSFLFFYGRCPENVLQEKCTEGLKSFNYDISSWDTSGVTSMDSMFFGCEKFNSDISGWNVGKVENLDRTFYNAREFNSNVGLWDVSSVKQLDHAFKGATSFARDLSHWKVG